MIRYNLVSICFCLVWSGYLSAQTDADDSLFTQIEKQLKGLEQHIGLTTKFISFNEQKDSSTFSRADYNSLLSILQGYRITAASQHHYQRQESSSRITYTAQNNQMRLRTLQVERSGSEIIRISWLYRTKSILGHEETTATLHDLEGFTLSTTEDKWWFGRHRVEINIPFGTYK